jgi:hypothetical protein
VVTEFEKLLYNKWLATARSKIGQPFKLRKNWEGFEEKKEYITVKKLANMLKKYDNINIDDYFNAPYTVYDDGMSYPLSFYSTLKAVKCYKIFLMKKHNLTEQDYKKLLTTKKTS